MKLLQLLKSKVSQAPKTTVLVVLAVLSAVGASAVVVVDWDSLLDPEYADFSGVTVDENGNPYSYPQKALEEVIVLGNPDDLNIEGEDTPVDKADVSRL